MGTRNLTIVILGGETKVAQYCQWDGYPTEHGQGATVLQFCVDHLRTVQFVERLSQCKFLSDEEAHKLTSELIGEDSEWINMEQSDKIKKTYPSLHRDTGADILNLINKSKTPLPLVDASDFLSEGSCEWAYTINLDDNTLTVHASGDMLKTYHLDKLPTQKKFETELFKIVNTNRS